MNTSSLFDNLTDSTESIPENFVRKQYLEARKQKKKKEKKAKEQEKEEKKEKKDKKEKKRKSPYVDDEAGVDHDSNTNDDGEEDDDDYEKIVQKGRDDEEKQQLDSEDVDSGDNVSKASASTATSKGSKGSKGSKKSRISRKSKKSKMSVFDFTQAQLFAGLDEKEKTPMTGQPPLDEWRYAEEFDEISKQPIEDYKWCFPCIYTQLTQEADRNPDYAKMFDLVKESQGRVDDETLCEQVQTFYNKHLRGCIADESKPWSKRSVWTHIYEHNPCLEVDSYKDIKRYNKLIDMIYENCIFLPSDGSLSINHTNVKLFMALNQERNRLQRQLLNTGLVKKTI